MFDTMKVARKIKEARIARNMTQMNLADVMEVSYQAVSNWERGNSMPDISKLEQLCNALQISLEELLGTDASTKTVTKIIENEKHPSQPEALSTSISPAINLEEAADILPLLPPAQIKQIVEENIEQEEESINLSAIVGMAPFLDAEYLYELVKKAKVNSLSEISCLAPFLNDDALDILVEKAPDSDLSGVLSLAPFLSQKTLDKLVLRFNGKTDSYVLQGLAPFLNYQTLDYLVTERLENGCSIQDLSGLYPFLSKETLRKLADQLLKQGKYKDLQNISPFF